MGPIKKLLFVVLVSSTLGSEAAGHARKFVDTPLANKALDGPEGALARGSGKTPAQMALARQKAAVRGLPFAQHLGRNLQAAAIETGAHSALEGGPVGRNLTRRMAAAAVQAGSARLAHKIGQRYAHGAGDMSWLTHKLCHFVLGGTTAELTGGDFLAGGVGATVGEIVADTMIQHALEQTREDVRAQLDAYRDEYGELPPIQEAEALTRLTYLEYLEAEQEHIQHVGRLAAAGTALVSHMDVAVADAAAEPAIEYNSIGSQIASLKNWVGEYYRVVQVWLDEHEFISIFVPGSLWISLEGKIDRGERLTPFDFTAMGMSFIPIVGNASVKGGKALAIRSGKKAQREYKKKVIEHTSKPQQKAMSSISDAANKVPYDARAMESLLQKNHPGAKVTSSTLPPVGGPNVRAAGNALEKEVTLPLGSTRTISVPFDNRGLPIFDKFAVAETRISGDLTRMSSDAHMRLATRQLREDIEVGRVNKNLFTEKQLDAISKGDRTIPGFTWHHDGAVKGRMQLVPEEIHRTIGHQGGNTMWGSGK